MKNHPFVSAAVTGLLLVGLTACGGDGEGGGDDGSDEPTPSDATPSASPDPGAAAAECFTGHEWQLDVDDLAGQAATFMQSTGAPITGVEGSGGQRIQFNADGLVAMYTDVTFTGRIETNGASGTATAHRVDEASGEWAWIEGEDSIRIGIENWSWLTEETTSSATVNGITVPGSPVTYPVYDLSVIGAITVDCDGGSLTLSGESGPFVSRWSR